MLTSIEQMNANIEQMKANMAKMRADIRADRVKITLQIGGLFIGAFAAGIAAATYFGHLAR